MSEPARTIWHAVPAEEVAARLGSTEHGLPAQEAAARLARHGPNRLPEAQRRSNFAILLHQFTSPLIYILLVAAVITLLIGHTIDAAVIFAAVLLNAIIGYPQERKAERSVEALMHLVTPHARVLRGGHELEIESAALVPGDLVLLESGTRVPADLRLVSTTALMVDESMLTGESEPTSKGTAVLPEATQLGDRADLAFTGTVVTTGRARGYVVATGADTELGAIAGSIERQPPGETPLQGRMRRFSRVVTAAVGISAGLAFGLGLALGGTASEMFLVAVALAVAAIPEGLPVVQTITLAVGVRRMAARQAIVRRLPAIETLGSTTVIGSDKTGTLTENRMTLRTLWAAGSLHEGDAIGASEAARMVLLAGVLDNEADVFEHEGEQRSTGDPLEVALLVAAAKAGIAHEDARAAHRLFAQIPFESERRYSATVRERDGVHATWAKGAPERVLDMCGERYGERGPEPLDRDEVLAAAHTLASQGLRVLALAWREHEGPACEPGGDVPEPERLVLLGLVGLLDPPRGGVPEAIAAVREAGIRVLMITGDHASTARAIAESLALSEPGARIVTGAELEGTSDEELRTLVAEAPVYARMAPEHKLRVVQALKASGEVVAVTGDGVNDAPALRAADIGIAMGRSGTDVAREAADMVLATDDFVSIAAAVEQGRYTFDNLRKVVFFLISTAWAAILSILVAIAFGWPLPLLPAQLLWINLVTTGLQDVTLALEPGDPALLHRRPRDPHEGIVPRLLWERTALTGAVMAACTLAMFHWAREGGGSLEYARTVALTTLVVLSAFHVGNARSSHRSLLRMNPFSNRYLFVVTGAALVLHAAALYLPPTQYVLRVVPLEPATWLHIAAVASSVLVVVEIDKWLRRIHRAR